MTTRPNSDPSTEPKVPTTARCWCGRRATEFIHYVPRWLAGHRFYAMPDFQKLADMLANDPEYLAEEP